MKGKGSKSQRSMKQSSLFEYTSPRKAGPSTKTESTPIKKRKKTVTTPRKSTQTLFPITPRSSTKPTKTYHLSESEGSSEDIGRIKLQKKASTSSSSSSSEASSSDSSDDSDEAPRPTQARRLEKLAAFVDHDEADDDPPMRARNTTSKRRKLRSAASSDEDSDGEVAPKRRRLTRARKTPVAKGADSEDEDIDDLEQEHVLDSRLRERGKKSEFQKNLERMKKRKLGQSVSSDSEEAEDEEGEESEQDTKPFKGAKKTHGSLFGSDEEEKDSECSQSDDFIVEDDGKVELPAEFSMETHQDLQHQFKKIFQFFVHIAVQRPHLRKKFMEENMKNREYFSVPLQIARRKLDGLRDSLVASSVWRLEYIKALRLYPAFSLTHLDFAVNGCDACHLGSRISTFTGRLDGVPYDRVGFLPLHVHSKKKPEKKRKRKRRKAASSDSESSSDSSSSSGSEVQQLKKDFDLGKFCARRTQVYHNFLHWEYELFNAIAEQVEEVRAQQGKKKSKQFYRVAYAGGKQPPEDLDDADGLTEWLDERGIVEREWQRIKLIMSSARKLEIDGKKGGDLDTS